MVILFILLLLLIELLLKLTILGAGGISQTLLAPAEPCPLAGRATLVAGANEATGTYTTDGGPIGEYAINGGGGGGACAGCGGDMVVALNVVATPPPQAEYPYATRVDWSIVASMASEWPGGSNGVAAMWPAAVGVFSLSHMVDSVASGVAAASEVASSRC